MSAAGWSIGRAAAFDKDAVDALCSNAISNVVAYQLYNAHFKCLGLDGRH